MASPTVYSVVIFSHRYLDSECMNFKTFVFLAVYWSIWTSSYNTDIKGQQFLNGASTMLNNVFNFKSHSTFLSIWQTLNFCFYSLTSFKLSGIMFWHIGWYSLKWKAWLVSLMVYSVVRFSHRYLDSDCMNFKTVVFLAVYWSIWTTYTTHTSKFNHFKMEPPQC